jgi:predicted amidohydrolase YtcJ
VSEPVPVLVSVPALILKPVLTLMLRLTLVLALGCHPALAASSATTLLLHGHIYTGDPRRPWVTALAVDATRISAVGSDAEIARLRDYAALHPADAILFARADFSTVPPTTPTAALLDRAVPDRPLLVHNTSEHALWLNSAALALAGITAEPVADTDEERGVLRDASGRPADRRAARGGHAARGARRCGPARRRVAIVNAACSGGLFERLRDHGVVNATGDLAELRLYAALRDRGELTLRTRTSFGSVAVRHRLSAQFLSDLDEARSLYHDDWVAANLVKFFADGSTGLVPPLVYTPQEYSALALEFDRRGFQLMTHALREDSVHMILDTYEHIQQAHGTRDTPAERIDVEAAVRAYTRGSAYAAFFDDRVGTLEVGKLADLAVLSQDIFAIEPTAIGATRVTLTMVGGKVVYRGP